MEQKKKKKKLFFCCSDPDIMSDYDRSLDIMSH